MSTPETLHEDVIALLPSFSSNASMEQTTNQKQADGCSSMKTNEGQVTGRRSLRRTAEKVVSYNEIPLNVKDAKTLKATSVLERRTGHN
jgi:hypothetical protein